MSRAGGARLTVRVYRGVPVADRFLDKYQEILEENSTHAAGAFIRDCVLRGYAELEEDGLHKRNGDSSNTHENNNEIVSNNGSDINDHPGVDAGTEVKAIACGPEMSGNEQAGGLGIRGMVSRLGIGGTQGKANET